MDIYSFPSQMTKLKLKTNIANNLKVINYLLIICFLIRLIMIKFKIIYRLIQISPPIYCLQLHFMHSCKCSDQNNMHVLYCLTFCHFELILHYLICPQCVNTELDCCFTGRQETRQEQYKQMPVFQIIILFRDSNVYNWRQEKPT